MWILPFVGYLGTLVGFGFLTLAIASGLYYLSELVEEHTVLTKKLLTRLIQIIIVIHGSLLVLDRFPFFLTVFSAASHGVYMLNLRRFPVVKLSDPVFIASCLLVGINHFLWFRHFSGPHDALREHIEKTGGAWGDRHDSSGSDPYIGAPVPRFREISSFFGLCVWLIPFALFVSLNAGENTLPSMSELQPDPIHSPTAPIHLSDHHKAKRGGPGIAKIVIDKVKTYFESVGEKLGWTGDVVSRRRFD
ncbi:transmembrane adaptor Erv26 [Peziza echinospora]|nr:transmembrane adaptor Erv26 [Peziza echinospora]